MPPMSKIMAATVFIMDVLDCRRDLPVSGLYTGTQYANAAALVLLHYS